MNSPNSQILTVAQMRAAEEALIAGGTGVDALMRLAGRGAAEWIYRMAWPRPVTVLCGPGNNGGDGYVIAEALRERHIPVLVIAPFEPASEAAKNARADYGGDYWTREEAPDGAVLVDCLFGSGLVRPLGAELVGLVGRLTATHERRVAIDLPSGIESDSGRPLDQGLPDYTLTIALGAWKFAHWTMPAAANMGECVLVPIGVEEVAGAAQLVGKPRLSVPAAGDHKYSRGLLAVCAGEMPGAALLASRAAMHGGAGYVKLAADRAPISTPAELVVDPAGLADTRLGAALVGPGLGRADGARARLGDALARNVPLVVDADGLMLLEPGMLDRRSAPVIATPHEGELAALASAFGINASGKLAVARELARASGMVVLAKGADSLVAGPGGDVALARPAPSWLSTAGTGDVLAGLVASRLATGREPFTAACEALWLHGEAARRAGTAFSASDLIAHIPAAYAACL